MSKDLTKEEMISKINELALNVTKLRISRAKGELKDPQKIKHTRHEIARLKNYLRSKA